MQLFQTILAQLAPHDCLGCRTEGALVCADCRRTIQPLPERCYHCRRFSPGSRTCKACRGTSELFVVKARAAYTGVAKDLIWRLKFSGAQAAAQEMATMMRSLLDADPTIVLVPVPTATTRVRKRGYDQALLLARALAKRSGNRYSPALRRLGQHHQVGATRQQRITQLQTAYRCIRPASIQGAHVVLIDDVLTTGATFEAAAKVLKAAGAKHVSGLVFAQA
jgi:ComF family protein